MVRYSYIRVGSPANECTCCCLYTDSGRTRKGGHKEKLTEGEARKRGGEGHDYSSLVSYLALPCLAVLASP